MAHWNCSSESGILRKNKPKENHEELLVFGYSCKLFRDNEKALYIDQGKHLIPWMGDEKLKIDRYDCRGALSDIRMYESSREGFDAMRWLGLSESERKLEELCDKERYHSLHNNEEEEEMYKEEEQKRQQTNAIQYSYDVPMDPESNEKTVTVPETDEDEEYLPPPGLDVPVDIEIPKTVKENARIEKTAVFVCKQGPQMEILIKAKQGNNPQFSFLNQGDPLYKFYRHVLSAFKNCRYKGQTNTNAEEKSEPSSECDVSGHYLHPSLLSTIVQSDAQSSSSTIGTIPAIPYKPSANCAYSQLVNRIQQGSQSDVQSSEPPKQIEAQQNFAQMTYEQQQYYQYYYASQYYEYYKQLAQYQQNSTPGGDVQDIGHKLQPPDFQLEPNVQNYIQQMAYTQYNMQLKQLQPPQTSNNSYAQIVSNVNKDVSNPYTVKMATLPVPNVLENANITKQPVLYSAADEEFKATAEKTVLSTPVQVKTKCETKSEVKLKKPLLSLAQYGTDSENEEDKETEQREVYNVPAGETQIVIDKMAIYVSKNGEQFEETVKARGDPRFEFLHDSHEYNKYYREKIKELKNEKLQVQLKEEEQIIEKAIDVSLSRAKEKKIIAPVSFSIKKAKEEQPKEIKSALPLEESDEEDVDNLVNTNNSFSTTPSVISNGKTTSPDSLSVLTEVKGEELTDGSESNQPKNELLLDGDDPILEMIDLTDDIEERKDAKRAEDRIKDKLAAAAREKLASVSRDRALQLERKKRAAAFLKLKSVETGGVTVDISVPEQITTISKYNSNVSSIKEPIHKERELERKRAKQRSNSKERHFVDVNTRKSRERTRSTDKQTSPKKDVVHIQDTDSDEKDLKKSRKQVKKKKTHKRKHSRSKHEGKNKRKFKKRRRRSDSSGSNSSNNTS